MEDMTSLWMFFLLLTVMPNHVTTEEAFDLFFVTNKEELLDYPVLCEKPLPMWLKGTFILNGPGQFEMGRRNFTHPFDGYSKLHAFKFQGEQQILFSTRFLRTHFYNQSEEKGTVAPFLLFDSVEPPFSFWEKLRCLYNGIENTNVNVYQFGKRGDRKESQFVAVSDFWPMYEFNPDTLSDVDRIMAPLPGGPYRTNTFLPLPSSSHPVREFGTDNYINFVTEMNPIPFGKSHISLIRIKSAKERQFITRFTVDAIPYMHSFALSRNYAVLFLCPLYINQGKMVRSLRPLDSLDWHPDQPTKIVVINIHTGQQIHMETENVFVMHHVNSFQSNSSVIHVDMVTYPNISVFRFLKFSNLHNPSKRDRYYVKPTLKRYTVNLKTRKVTVRVLQPVGDVRYAAHMDMPVINNFYRFSQHCYIYGYVAESHGTKIGAALARKNVCGGPDLGWSEHEQFPTEPWFEAHPNGVKEDEGVLLSVVLDGLKRESYLGVYDPTTMKQVNKCPLPHIMPFTIHGRFFPEL